MLAFLAEDGPFLLASRQNLGELVRRTEQLLADARSAGEVLYVGILGGTGVGKSTLINALAQSDISPSSEQRPLTDKAVVYRHRNTPRGLDRVSHLVRSPDAVHESDTVKDLVLLDLPDFDSVKHEHYRAVTAILPLLDCVIWVASPEKYADESFYDCIRDTAINKENFTFVLNKADMLRSEDSSERLVRYKELLGDFTFRLKHDAHVNEPRVFVVSAIQEFQGRDGDPVLIEEFQRFRNFLMARRDAKEIASIKVGNLAEKARRLLVEIKSQVRPDEKRRGLDSLAAVTSGVALSEAGSESIIADYALRLSHVAFPALLAEDPSVWPVRLAMKALAWTRSMGKRSTGDVEAVLLDAAAALGKDPLLELETFSARFDAEALLAFRDAALGTQRVAPEEIVAAANASARSAFAVNLGAEQRSAAAFPRLRRGWQKLIFALPVIALIVKLTGISSIESSLASLTVSAAFNAAVSFVATLFSSEGLTGIAVLLICEGLLAVWLGSRRLRRLDRRSGILGRSTIEVLNRSLRSDAQAALAAKNEMVRRVDLGLKRLARLTLV